MLLILSFASAQNSTSLVGKTFELTDKLTNDRVQYSFLSNKKVNLIMFSEINGKHFQDKCSGLYTIEGNKIKVNCNCEDKEIYPNPLKETFIYDKNTLLTTIHLDQNKNPQIFYLKS